MQKSVHMRVRALQPLYQQPSAWALEAGDRVPGVRIFWQKMRRMIRVGILQEFADDSAFVQWLVVVLQSWDQATRIEVEKGARFVVGVHFDVLIWNLCMIGLDELSEKEMKEVERTFLLKYCPGSLYEWTAETFEQEYYDREKRRNTDNQPEYSFNGSSF